MIHRSPLIFIAWAYKFNCDTYGRSLKPGNSASTLAYSADSWDESIHDISYVRPVKELTDNSAPVSKIGARNFNLATMNGWDRTMDRLIWTSGYD